MGGYIQAYLPKYLVLSYEKTPLNWQSLILFSHLRKREKKNMSSKHKNVGCLSRDNGLQCGWTVLRFQFGWPSLEIKPPTASPKWKSGLNPPKLRALRGVFSSNRPKYLGKYAYDIPTHRNLLYIGIYFDFLKCIPSPSTTNPAQRAEVVKTILHSCPYIEYSMIFFSFCPH